VGSFHPVLLMALSASWQQSQQRCTKHTFQIAQHLGAWHLIKVLLMTPTFAPVDCQSYIL
jgi:hypothetical protein